MKYMEKEVKRVPRYSLILVKPNEVKYYYDFNLGTFVRMEENEVAPRTTLEKIDFLTSSYSSLEHFISCYGFNEPIKLLKISYQFKGENMIQPTFGNNEWKELARTYKGPVVDFRKDWNNRYIYEEIYGELVSLDENDDSKFGDFLVNLKGISPKTCDLIKLALAHERAIRRRYRELFIVKDSTTEGIIGGIYQEDKDAFKEAIKKKLSNYRELRTVYLNYCKFFKNKDKQNIISNTQDEPKKLVKEPPKQLSMFDDTFYNI